MSIRRKSRDTSFKGVALCEESVQNLFTYCYAKDPNRENIRFYFI